MITIIHTWKKPHKFTSSTQYIVHIDADGREQKILQAGKMSKSRDVIFPLLNPPCYALKIFRCNQLAINLILKFNWRATLQNQALKVWVKNHRIR